jgi:hypothetical protein
VSCGSCGETAEGPSDGEAAGVEGTGEEAPSEGGSTAPSTGVLAASGTASVGASGLCGDAADVFVLRGLFDASVADAAFRAAAGVVLRVVLVLLVPDVAFVPDVLLLPDVAFAPVEDFAPPEDFVPDVVFFVDVVFCADAAAFVDVVFFRDEDVVPELFVAEVDVVPEVDFASADGAVSSSAGEEERADDVFVPAGPEDLAARRRRASRAMAPAMSSRASRSRGVGSSEPSTGAPLKNMSTGRVEGEDGLLEPGSGRRLPVRRVPSSVLSGVVEGLVGPPAPGINAPSPRPSPRFCVMSVLTAQHCLAAGTGPCPVHDTVDGCPSPQVTGRMVNSRAAARYARAPVLVGSYDSTVCP